jgi:hypothetical protein
MIAAHVAHAARMIRFRYQSSHSITVSDMVVDDEIMQTNGIERKFVRETSYLDAMLDQERLTGPLSCPGTRRGLMHQVCNRTEQCTSTDGDELHPANKKHAAYIAHVVSCS